MIVQNAKGTEVLKFPVEKLALDLKGYKFTLDQVTYRIMSKYGAAVIDMLQEVEQEGGPEAEWAKQSGGPFIITSKVGKGTDKYLVCDKGGILNYSQQIKQRWFTANGPRVRFSSGSKQGAGNEPKPPPANNRFKAFEEEEEEIKVEDVNEDSSDEEAASEAEISEVEDMESEGHGDDSSISYKSAESKEGDGSSSNEDEERSYEGGESKGCKTQENQATRRRST
jgi:hypothetical protein